MTEDFIVVERDSRTFEVFKLCHDSGCGAVYHGPISSSTKKWDAQRVAHALNLVEVVKPDMVGSQQYAGGNT